MWVNKLFKDYDEILKLFFLSDGEKIGYLIAQAYEHPEVPSKLTIYDRAEVIREYYMDHMVETGC